MAIDTHPLVEKIAALIQHSVGQREDLGTIEDILANYVEITHRLRLAARLKACDGRTAEDEQDRQRGLLVEESAFAHLQNVINTWG